MPCNRLPSVTSQFILDSRLYDVVLLTSVFERALLNNPKIDYNPISNSNVYMIIDQILKL